jgi:lipopolysaccharide/colanic/teichoic acid biosynthesis glycosyltransferase
MLRRRSQVTLVDVSDEAEAGELFSSPSGERMALNEEAFRQMVVVERKRTERSGMPFLLMLLTAGNQEDPSKVRAALGSTLSALLSSTRQTDVIGWYKKHTTIGVVFTGFTMDERNTILSTILTKVSNTLRDHLPPAQFNQLSVSFHFFPDDWDHDAPGRPSNPVLYQDLLNRDSAQRSRLTIKRVMDIAGSSLALVGCLPLFVLIALLIKASSRGPVLFRQQRVGHHGRCFTFLKFRSMQMGNDPSAHKEYVTRLINGVAEQKPTSGNGQGVYKLVNDQRITRVGKFLRKSSLDELPQLLNVLRGEMSLVGPRPSIPYEVAAYQTWHRRRVLEVKPGMTGLWQVNGRNRIKFDEMVRLDLQYAKQWSPWLDLKILMHTPSAVLKGAC